MEGQNYKTEQRNKKKRMCTVHSGKSFVDDQSRLYSRDKDGSVRFIGLYHGGHEVSVGREPKNKKERRKAEKGLAYLDKKGVMKAD